ncbi:hypothetical protein ACOMHN_065434 [Nucella lapillus]
MPRKIRLTAPSVLLLPPPPPLYWELTARLIDRAGSGRRVENYPGHIPFVWARRTLGVRTCAGWIGGSRGWSTRGRQIRSRAAREGDDRQTPLDWGSDKMSGI